MSYIIVYLGKCLIHVLLEVDMYIAYTVSILYIYVVLFRVQYGVSLNMWGGPQFKLGH